MKLKNIYRQILRESVTGTTYFHGTRSLVPFKEFDPRMEGSGIVSSGNSRYGGMFFTDNIKNAEYYTEYLTCEVSVNNLEINDTGETHPPTVMKLAKENGKNYFIEDVLDGSHHSNIVVVPMENLSDVKITKWNLATDENVYREALDDFFDKLTADDEYADRDSIEEVFSMMDLDLDYCLSFKPFKDYFEERFG